MMRDSLAIGLHYCAKRMSLARLKHPIDVKRLQDNRLRDLMLNAAKSFGFYAPWASKPFADWPIVDKALHLENFAGMNEAGLSRELAWEIAEAALKSSNGSGRYLNYTIGTSTGTSGQRGLFMISDHERRLWLASILARCLPEFPPSRHRVALLLATGNALYETSKAARRLRFEFFDLRKGLDVHVDALERYQPDILIGSPQAISTLAARQVKLPLAHVFTGGEVLDELHALQIENWFGLKPRSIYQATEGFLGVSCQHGSIHLNEDDMIFEEEPVEGQVGHFTPVITDLRRRSQAMIRYRLNDILVERPEPCPCGCPLKALQRIDGRMDDVVRLPGRTGGRVISIMPEALRATVLDAARSIQDFRIVQRSPNHLLLCIKGDGWQLARAGLLAYFARLQVHQDVTIDIETDIREEFQHKMRRVLVKTDAG